MCQWIVDGGVVEYRRQDRSRPVNERNYLWRSSCTCTLQSSPLTFRACLNWSHHRDAWSRCRWTYCTCSSCTLQSFPLICRACLIEMSVDWEKVNERLPYKKGEEGQLILQHLCVTKCFCETPIIVARTSAEGFRLISRGTQGHKGRTFQGLTHRHGRTSP